MDQYADDLAELMNHLDLDDRTMVGHSTGGGKVVRYIARHGQKRVVKSVLIAAVPPLMLKTETNPGAAGMFEIYVESTSLPSTQMSDVGF